jgi:hypothetical protein
MISSVSSDYSAAAARAQLVDRFFQQVDTNRDSKITEDELAQALQSSSSSADSAGSTDAAKGAEELFQLLDSEGKGFISRQDISDEIEKLQQSGDSQSAQTAETGAPPVGGGGGGGGGAGAAAATLDDLTLDPADTNGDGAVSAAEEIAYALKHYAEQSSDSSPTTTSELYA